MGQKLITFFCFVLLASTSNGQQWLEVPEDLQEAATQYDQGFQDIQVINDELVILAGAFQIVNPVIDFYQLEDLEHHWFKIRNGEIESIRQPLDTFGLSTFAPRIIRPYQDKYLVAGLFGYTSHPDSIHWGIMYGDDTEWELFENSWMDAKIYDMAVRDSSFFVAGAMHLIDGPEMNAQGIIRWNGETWDDFGGGNCDWPVSDFVGAVALEDQSIVYGGSVPSFCDYASGETFNSGYIVRNLGAGWEPIGTGMNSSVFFHSIDSATDVTYFMGGFSSANGTAVTRITGYDGANFFSLPDLDLFGNPLDVVRYRGQLFVTGYFNEINDEIGYHSLARFDGVNWQKVGHGSGQFTGGFNHIVAFEDNLWFSGPGDIVIDGEIWSENIGILHMTPEEVTWGQLPNTPDVWQAIEEKDQKAFGLHLYPNPTDGPLNIKFNQAVDGEIIITDQAGKQIFLQTLNQESELKVDLSQHQAGTYLVHFIQHGVILESVRVVLE